jgi:hypothetical protein
MEREGRYDYLLKSTGATSNTSPENTYENGFSANEWNPTSYANNYFNAFTFDAMGNILTRATSKTFSENTSEFSYSIENQMAIFLLG